MRNPLSRLGPGLITGVADDDPSAITVFTIAGATGGYRVLWVWLLTLPMGIAIQTICGRLGLLTGSGLTTIFVRQWGRRRVAPVVGLLVVSWVLSICADLGAIGAVGEMLFGVRSYVVIPFVGAFVLLIEVRSSYRKFARLLRWGALVTLVYFAGAAAARPDVNVVFAATVVPQVTLDRTFLGILVALFGALISPYIYFWQTNEESEERAVPWSGMASEAERLRGMRVDVVAGMLAANAIYYFVALTAAAALFAHGATDIVTVRDAAAALRPLAGDAAYVLFAAGILISGLVAIPVLAGTAGYAVSEVAGWSEGLSRPFRQARPFYGVIIASTVLGVVTSVAGLPAVPLLFIAAIVNGLLAPIVLAMIMLVASRVTVSGGRPSRVTLVVGWGATALTAAGAIAFVAGVR